MKKQNKALTQAQVKAYLAKKKLEANLAEYQRHLIIIVGALSSAVESMEAVNEVLPNIITNGLVNHTNNFLNSIAFNPMEIPKDRTLTPEQWNEKNEQHKKEVFEQYVKTTHAFNEFIKETFIIEK
jgi:hypothetical protein